MQLSPLDEEQGRWSVRCLVPVGSPTFLGHSWLCWQVLCACGTQPMKWQRCTCGKHPIQHSRKKQNPMRKKDGDLEGLHRNANLRNQSIPTWLGVKQGLRRKAAKCHLQRPSFVRVSLKVVRLSPTPMQHPIEQKRIPILGRMRTNGHPTSERVQRGIPVQNLPMQRDNWFRRNRMQRHLLDADGFPGEASLVLL